MNELNENIWTVDQNQKYHGIEVGTRMTIIRLENDQLMLISPISIDDDLAKKISNFGVVSYVIAPNLYHHLYLRACCERYSDAQVYVAEGLGEKYEDLGCSELSSDTPKEWAEHVEQTVFDGFAVLEMSGHVELNEVVFYHKESKTLVVTDAAYHIASSSKFVSRLLAKIAGTYEVLGPSKLEQIATKRRLDAQEALLTILSWNFDAVVMAHGEVIETGGKEKLTEGSQWLLSSPQFNKQVQSAKKSSGEKTVPTSCCG